MAKLDTRPPWAPTGSVDAPPQVRADEKLNTAELATLAITLLQQLAQHDPAIAEEMRKRGIGSGQRFQ